MKKILRAIVELSLAGTDVIPVFAAFTLDRTELAMTFVAKTA